MISRSDKYVSTGDPTKALGDPRIAHIFRSYIDNLAGWYDLNDRRRHFTDIVPILARKNSLLLSAILAFAAASQSSSSGSTQDKDLADAYHLESVRRLLALMKHPDEFRTGETLAAICLLRSYEIISQNVTCQNHLQGSYSLLASHPIELESGLLSAGFWNYLREDITVALIEKRSLMIQLSDEPLPTRTECDDDLANRITYLLGRVINRCLLCDAVPLDQCEWNGLRDQLEDWRTSLPSSFDPILTPDLLPNSAFPGMWTTSGWHAAGLQYYHTAMIILWLAEPGPSSVNTLQHIERINRLETKLGHHATIVCALALSSRSAPVWVNSFGPIAFCGPWLKDAQKLSEIVDEMSIWGQKTGWPVESITYSLLNKSQ